MQPQIVGCRMQTKPFRLRLSEEHVRKFVVLNKSKSYMNALRNKVQLIGRLGKNPELINFEEGKTKCTFPVATNEVFRNGEGERVERTQWHDVVTWGALAEIAGQYLKKGVEIAIEGRLAYRTYEDSEGHTRYVTEVVAGEMLMLDRRSSEEEEA